MTLLSTTTVGQRGLPTMATEPLRGFVQLKWFAFWAAWRDANPTRYRASIPVRVSGLTCTGLVCQRVEDVSGVVGEVGLCSDLVPGKGDRDVLQRAEVWMISRMLNPVLPWR